MSAPSFTQGPWSVYAGDGCVIVNAEGSSLGEMTSGDPYISHDEEMANARLAAAAPELYEALREAKGLADMAVMSDDQDGTPSDDQEILVRLRAKIDAALAKARGTHQPTVADAIEAVP